METNDSKRIPPLLKVFAWISTGLATACYLIALRQDLTVGGQYFARAGALSVFLVVLLFFVSQSTGFFTFYGADNMHNVGHAAQRAYLTRFEGYLLVTGTFVWGFGDWIVNLISCGKITCSS